MNTIHVVVSKANNIPGAVFRARFDPIRRTEAIQEEDLLSGNRAAEAQVSSPGCAKGHVVEAIFDDGACRQRVSRSTERGRIILCLRLAALLVNLRTHQSGVEVITSGSRDFHGRGWIRRSSNRTDWIGVLGVYVIDEG